MITSKRVVGACCMVLAAAAIWWAQAIAETRQGSDFQPSDAVDSVELELTVSADGEDLDEPIALDLGLGFPFWLQSLGRVDGASAPFGAVAQRGVSAHSIRAGERATFSFSMTGDAGLDDLRATPQLLAGVHVGDISRVALTSRAERGWVIASYRLRINGKLFVENTAVNVNGRGAQDAARERLTELNRDLAPLQTELADLESLATAGLATDADRARSVELRETIGSRGDEQRRIERQLRGAAPFFAEGAFRPLGRSGANLGQVKVSVVTAPHSGAESLNYVYFRTGGHKYVLGGPVSPLTPDAGPQEFELNLAAAPLTAGDLRGFALGMIAQRQPYGEAPDRWHPQRLRVEVDGRVVYDSEDSPLDRASLSAIRLIPPAHVGTDGMVRENVPVAREAFVWTAGSGAGLDLVRGGAESLPAPDDPAYPLVEPGLHVDGDVTIIEENWYDLDADPFPGEAGFGPGWQPGWNPGWGPGWGPPWGAPPPPWWDPGWGPGFESGPSWLDLILLGLLDHFGLLPDWVIPHPVGEPPQLERVWIDYAAGTVNWEVTGNTAQIQHFVIDRVLVRPDLDVPLVSVVGMAHTVGGEQRSLPLADLEPLMLVAPFDEQSRNQLAIRVALVPTDPAIGVDFGLAPAVPLRTTPGAVHLNLAADFEYTPVVGPVQHPAVTLGGPPEFPGRAVWPAGEIAAHNGVVFAGLSPLQQHVVVRGEQAGDHVEIRFTGMLPPGTYRLIAFTGFWNAVEAPAAANVGGLLTLTSVINPALDTHIPSAAHVEADPMLPPSHLEPLITDFNTADVGPGPMLIDLRYHFNHLAVDPRHPPVLYGVRVIPH